MTVWALVGRQHHGFCLPIRSVQATRFDDSGSSYGDYCWTPFGQRFPSAFLEVRWYVHDWVG